MNIQSLSGGPLGLDARVAHVFLAQVEVTAADGEKACLAAAKRRDALLRGLDARQRDLVRLVCDATRRVAV